MIVGTAGHVDHGKTTLVRALTGVDTDRLPEEKRRGMTIELGYAYAGALGFVDVPGHERFVHTMLAGAGGIDAALLVVAADEGVKPQTVEHARILDLLGIAGGVIALTRTDRAPGRIEAVAAEVRTLLDGGRLAEAAICPVCAPSGEGVEALRAALLALGTPPRDARGQARLAVDRVFSLPGAGLVVAGTLVAGRVAVGDRLVVSPSGAEARVRGLHAHHRPAEAASAGRRVALNLAGPRLGQVARGDWVLHPALHAPTGLLDASFRAVPGEAMPREGAPVHLHLGAAHVTARVFPLGEGAVRLVADRPVGALAGDRFVLRDGGATRTLGGGAVLDPWPPRRHARTPARLAALAALGRSDAEALAGLLRERWIEAVPFARARNLPPARFATLLAGAGGVEVAGLALRAEMLAGLRRALTAGLGAHHVALPDEPGLQPERLRLALSPRPPVPLFRALVAAALRRGEIRQDGPWLLLPPHRVVLSGQDERLWRQVRARIAAERFRPPRTRDLAGALRLPEPAMRAALKRFARLGRLVQVAPDHFFLRETVAEMAGCAAALAAGSGVLTAAAFRDRLGSGRKVAIQVLEFFDGTGITHRSGDARRVVAARLGLYGPPTDA